MKKIILCSILIALIGCSSNKINHDNSNIIYMSTDKAPADCKFLGQIYGPHETFTSGSNPHLGRNISQTHITQAKQLGANYIEMSSGSTGEAYSCPNSELAKMKQYDWNN